MGAAASVAATAGGEALISKCSPKQPRRWSKRRERPYAVFGPEYFRGLVYTQLNAKDPASAGYLNRVDVTVQAWRDKVTITRTNRGRSYTTTFKADPPVGLVGPKGCLLQLRRNGLLWGRHGGPELVDHATMILWHFEHGVTVQRMLRRTFAAAESL